MRFPLGDFSRLWARMLGAFVGHSMFILYTFPMLLSGFTTLFFVCLYSIFVVFFPYSCCILFSLLYCESPKSIRNWMAAEFIYFNLGSFCYLGSICSVVLDLVVILCRFISLLCMSTCTEITSLNINIFMRSSSW